MITETRQLLIELTEVETPEQAEKFSTRLETAWEWGLISRDAYEHIKGIFQVYLKYEGIETESKSNQ